MKKRQIQNEPDKNLPPWLEISEHPKYWDGQLFPEWELLLMNDGGCDSHYERWDLDEPELHS